MSSRATFAGHIKSFQQMSSFINGTTLYTPSLGGDEAKRLAKDNVYIGKDSIGNYISLIHGNILLIPDQNIVIGTNLGIIKVPAKTEIFIIKSDNGLVIYDLFQQTPKQITVAIKHKTFVLKAGSMLVLTMEKVQNFEQIDANCHEVNCSNVKELHLLQNDEKAFTADFSITSAINTIYPLLCLTQSHN